jgi:hypothetical protein
MTTFLMITIVILCAIQYEDKFFHLEVFDNLSFVLMNAEEKYSWNLATWLLAFGGE